MKSDGTSVSLFCFRDQLLCEESSLRIGTTRQQSRRCKTHTVKYVYSIPYLSFAAYTLVIILSMYFILHINGQRLGVSRYKHERKVRSLENEKRKKIAVLLGLNKDSACVFSLLCPLFVRSSTCRLTKFPKSLQNSRSTVNYFLGSEFERTLLQRLCKEMYKEQYKK